MSYEVIASLVPPPRPLPEPVIEKVSIETKFEGYIAKQQQHVERMQRLEGKTIPPDFNYETITGLRNEARQKFIKHAPRSLGQALPADARQAIARGLPGTWRVGGADLSLERIGGAVPALRFVIR